MIYDVFRHDLYVNLIVEIESEDDIPRKAIWNVLYWQLRRNRD